MTTVLKLSALVLIAAVAVISIAATKKRAAAKAIVLPAKGSAYDFCNTPLI